MDIQDLNIYGNFNLGFSFASTVIKLFAGIILFALVFYAFMLLLKLRVLKDTVEVSQSNIPKLAIAFNLILSTIGTIGAIILILL